MSIAFTLDLGKCQTVNQLSVALGVELNLLTSLAREDDFEQNYFEHKIPKRNPRRRGQHRVVVEVKNEHLRLVHRALARRLALHASLVRPEFPLHCSFGFVRNRSIRQNAARHLAAKILVRADIAQFFPSITRERTYLLLLGLGLAEAASELLSRIYCLRGELLQGLSGSPMIANLACHDLDKRLLAVCEPIAATYTRYADDISISGDAVPDRPQIEAALAESGFRLEPKKYRVTRPGQAQFVTGLSTTDSSGPHVPKWMKRKLRQELFYSRTRGLEDHFQYVGEDKYVGTNRINGMVRYVSFIETNLSSRLTNEWDAILEHSETLPIHHHSRRLRSGDVTLAFDETLISIDEESRLILGCSAIYSKTPIEGAVETILGDHLASPFAAGRKPPIEKNGLHYADAHPSLREKFINVLPMLPFGMYAMMTRSTPSYEEAYLDLLGRTALMQYSRLNGCRVDCLIEQNSHVSETRCRAMLTEIYQTMRRSGSPCPVTEPQITFVPKGQAAVVITDFMLGILRNYLIDGIDASRVSLLQFEQIRDRFQYFFDVDSRKTFNRKNPLNWRSLGIAAQ